MTLLLQLLGGVTLGIALLFLIHVEVHRVREFNRALDHGAIEIDEYKRGDGRVVYEVYTVSGDTRIYRDTLESLVLAQERGQAILDRRKPDRFIQTHTLEGSDPYPNWIRSIWSSWPDIVFQVLVWSGSWLALAFLLGLGPPPSKPWFSTPSFHPAWWMAGWHLRSTSPSSSC